MFGGLAVRANLLCVTWSAAVGHVFLFDVSSRQRVSAWMLPRSTQGYSDAAGVAIDEHFQVFVADPHNQCVRRFSAFGRHLGDLGAPATGDGDAARDRPGVLDRPHAVALQGDALLVTMGDRPRRRGVQRFLRDGTVLRPLASGGDPEAPFGAPRALWVDGAEIVVADTLRSRVQRFRADGTFVAHVPCAGPGALARPIAVARTAAGAVLVVDHGDEPGVRALALDGAPRPDARPLQERCDDPVAFAGDEQGRLYVLDRGGERVLRFGADLAFDAEIVDLAEHLDAYEPPSP
jgi:hypothetical protein